MKRLLPLALAAAFLPMACVHPGEPDPATADPDLASPVEIAGVGNFAKVTEGVWRGEQPTAEGFATLKKMGVKTVVNLRAWHSDRDEMKGLSLYHLHIKSTTLFQEDEDIAKFLRIATDPYYRPVFVHCQHGADRTGVSIAAYRVVVQGWPMSKARRELPIFGFHEIWQNLEKYLDDFDAERVRKKMGEVKVEVETVP
ncbi:MAG: tyrosine-protein phosphatase [Planctomycetes bacterium]|nr:tyrosine-protein phosphatase [Planctomycetota bacterium]